MVCLLIQYLLWLLEEKLVREQLALESRNQGKTPIHTLSLFIDGHAILARVQIHRTTVADQSYIDSRDLTSPT